MTPLRPSKMPPFPARPHGRGLPGASSFPSGGPLGPPGLPGSPGGGPTGPSGAPARGP